jgi:2'-phosphotransferase
MSSFAGRGGGGRQSKGSGRGDGRGNKNQRSNTVSRLLTRTLRHDLKKQKIDKLLRPDGFVPLSVLMGLPLFAASDFNSVMLLQILQDCKKQRMSVGLVRYDGTMDIINHMAANTLPECRDLWIRANQGHTIDGVDETELLTRIGEEEAVGMLGIHGTYAKALALIKASGGLSRMKRNHVHLAGGLDAASGMRADCTIVLWVNMERAMREGGLEFFRSSNGVILCAGDDKGFIDVRFIERVTERVTGKVMEGVFS